MSTDKKTRGPDAEWRKGFASKRSAGLGRPAVYPWPDWCDGNLWTVAEGEDFDMPLNRFRNVLNNRRIALEKRNPTTTSQIVLNTSVFDFETGEHLPSGHIQFAFSEEEPSDDNYFGPIRSVDVTIVSEATYKSGNKGNKGKSPAEARADLWCPNTSSGKHEKGNDAGSIKWPCADCDAYVAAKAAETGQPIQQPTQPTQQSVEQSIQPAQTRYPWDKPEAKPLEDINKAAADSASTARDWSEIVRAQDEQPIDSQITIVQAAMEKVNAEHHAPLALTFEQWQAQQAAEASGSEVGGNE